MLRQVWLSHLGCSSMDFLFFIYILISNSAPWAVRHNSYPKSPKWKLCVKSYYDWGSTDLLQRTKKEIKKNKNKTKQNKAVVNLPGEIQGRTRQEHSRSHTPPLWPTVSWSVSTTFFFSPVQSTNCNQSSHFCVWLSSVPDRSRIQQYAPRCVCVVLLWCEPLFHLSVMNNCWRPFAKGLLCVCVCLVCMVCMCVCVHMYVCTLGCGCVSVCVSLRESVRDIAPRVKASSLRHSRDQGNWEAQLSCTFLRRHNSWGSAIVLSRSDLPSQKWRVLKTADPMEVSS